LTNISEREIDIPFRLLLEAEGHIAIGHKTIHGPMELGKDIVSDKPDEGKWYFFQLKQGNIGLAEWDEVKRQMRQITDVPYVHPNYKIGDPFQPVWVCTGQLDETVRYNLGLENENLRREGKPAFLVWDRNILIDKFHSAFFDILFADESFVVDFIRLASHLADFHGDEKDSREFLRFYLNDLKSAKQRETRKHLATYVLMIAQLSQRYLIKQNIYSAIDLTILALVILIEHIVRNQIDTKLYSKALSHLESYLKFLLSDLVEACGCKRDLLQDLLEPQNGPVELFQYPLRVHSLASKIALLLILKKLRNEDSQREAQLLQIIVKSNLAFCHLITERQMGTFWIPMVGLMASEELALARECVIQTMDWFMSFHGEGKEGLPNPYEPYEAALVHLTGVEFERFPVYSMNYHSYFLPILLKLACHLNLRELVAKHWSSISRFFIKGYESPTEVELYEYFPKSGKVSYHVFPVTGSWKEIKEQFSERLHHELTQFTSLHPQSLLYLALAYPWRTQWKETERFI